MTKGKKVAWKRWSLQGDKNTTASGPLEAPRWITSAKKWRWAQRVDVIATFIPPTGSNLTQRKCPKRTSFRLQNWLLWPTISTWIPPVVMFHTFDNAIHSKVFFVTLLWNAKMTCRELVLFQESD
jgi:hypothetical protein